MERFDSVPHPPCSTQHMAVKGDSRRSGVQRGAFPGFTGSLTSLTMVVLSSQPFDPGITNRQGTFIQLSN